MWKLEWDWLGLEIEHSGAAKVASSKSVAAASSSKSITSYTAAKYAGFLGIGGVSFAVLGPLVVGLVAVGGLVWYYKFSGSDDAASAK